jgi:hypothetical protein
MSDIDDLFATLTAAQADKKRPPVHLWDPQNTGTIDIRIDSDGQWWHEGTVFQRQALVELFASILTIDNDQYFLITPVERLQIQVEDVPFMAIDMDVRGEGTSMELLFSTNVGDYIVADGEHGLHMRGERPYLAVRDGLEARLTRSVFYRLVDLGVEEEGALWIYSAGARFCLGNLQ